MKPTRCLTPPAVGPAITGITAGTLLIAEDRSQANMLQQRCMNMLLLAGTLLSGTPLTIKHIIPRLIAEDRFF